MERDAQFTQRKAERATLRSHFRDKYRLPKVSLGAWAGRHIGTLSLELPTFSTDSGLRNSQLLKLREFLVGSFFLRGEKTQRLGLGAARKPSLPKTDRFVFLEPVQAHSLPHVPFPQTLIRPRQMKNRKAVDFTARLNTRLRLSTLGAPAHRTGRGGEWGGGRECCTLCGSGAQSSSPYVVPQ